MKNEKNHSTHLYRWCNRRGISTSSQLSKVLNSVIIIWISDPGLTNLESALQSLSSWFPHNGLALNPGKSEAILFGTLARNRTISKSQVNVTAGERAYVVACPRAWILLPHIYRQLIWAVKPFIRSLILSNSYPQFLTDTPLIGFFFLTNHVLRSFHESLWKSTANRCGTLLAVNHSRNFTSAWPAQTENHP